MWFRHPAATVFAFSAVPIGDDFICKRRASIRMVEVPMCVDEPAAIDEAPKLCTAYLGGARDITSVNPPAPAKEKTFGGISDTVKGVLWYGPRESRDMRHTGSHLARTGSRLCPLSSCASQNVL